MLFNPVLMIGSDILLLTLELKGLHNYESLVFVSHIFTRISQRKATVNIPEVRLYWILSGISMRIQSNLLNIQDTKRMELGVSCFRAILKDTKFKKTENVTKQSFKLFNQEAFLNDLSLIPFLISYIFDDPDDVYCWESLYIQSSPRWSCTCCYLHKALYSLVKSS